MCLTTYVMQIDEISILFELVPKRFVTLCYFLLTQYQKEKAIYACHVCNIEEYIENGLKIKL